MSILTQADDRLNEVLRNLKGPLTDQLVRQPGAFGLGQVPSKQAPDATTSMICGFCATGCSLNVHLREGEGRNLTPTFDYPVNLGMACPKGWEALTPLEADDRATIPLLRKEDGEQHPVDWQEAAETFRDRMQAIIDEHGPESVAFLSTGQICSEEMAFLGSFAKFGMGIYDGDGNTRQCMATSVVSYKQSFGFDAPPYTYKDFEESDVIILVGSNLCIAHPIMWQRVLRNKRNPEIIVVDPRKTETAMQATQHFGIKPKSDLTFFQALAKLIVDRGGVDQDFLAQHTEGFEDYEQFLAELDLEDAVDRTGVSLDRLIEFADLIASGKRVSFWWTMGVNQGYEAVRTAQSMINLALMTGNIGKPGTGANSITGQCNAMGSRLFSNTTNLLGGHDFANQEHRAKIANLLGMDEDRIPPRVSVAYDQIIQRVREGKIKGLWIIATNPAHSWIGRDDFEEIMEGLDFLAVQDMYANTETAKLADLVLPAAAWGEKDGTFINSERRIGIVKRVAKAPGQALSDFNIFRLLSSTWGVGELFKDWSSPEAVFKILQKASKGQPCDISGIDGYRQIDEEGGVQWPLPESEANKSPEQERRLFSDGKFFHPNGKAKFLYDPPADDPEPVCHEFPIRLLTGRGSSAQWHTQTRTRKSKVLQRLAPKGNFVEIHPSDADRLGVVSGSIVEVSSRRGSIEVKAFISTSVPVGNVFIPMHESNTNELTLAAFDPHSRQPSYKACAVRVAVL